MTRQEFLDFVANNPEGTKFPGDPIFYGDLNLFCTIITWLPEGLRIIGGSLNLEGCWHLKRLPAKLSVDGDLRIAVTRIKRLPADLKVGGDVYANNLDLDIPDGYVFNGSLILSGNVLMQYPLETPLNLRNITVNGDLDVTKRVVKWPKKLIAKGRLIADSLDGVIIGGLDC